MSDQRRKVTTVAALVAGGAVIGAGLGLLFRCVFLTGHNTVVTEIQQPNAVGLSNWL